MKGVNIICDASTRDYLLKLASRKYPKLKSTIVIIDSIDSFEKSLKRFNANYKIWIFVNLAWSKNHTREGYNIALELMMQSKDDEVLDISFFSLLDRKTLLNTTNDEKNIFPKAFNHLQIPIVKVQELTEKKLSYPNYQYIKKYALSKANIIGDVLHKLDNINSSNRTSTIAEVIKKLQSIDTILNDDVRDCIKIVNQGEINISDLQHHLLHLKNLLNENDDFAKIKKKSDIILRTIIILDDNVEFANLLKSKIEGFCSNCFVYNQSNDAIQKIEFYQSTLDLLLCDLELLTSQNYWQDQQGIDVLEFVKKNHPKVYTVALSGLPSKAVKILLPSKNLANEQIRKRDILKPNIDLVEFFSPILNNAKKFSRRGLKKVDGPNKGIFDIIKSTYFGLKLSNDPEDTAIIFELHSKADKVYNHYLSDTLLNCDLWSSELISTKTKNEVIIWEKFYLILSLRKMILYYIVNNSSPRNSNQKVEYKFNYTTFKDKLGLEYLTNNFKDLINTKLCFNIRDLKENEDELECNIVIDNLFQEEYQFIDTLLQKSLSNKILDFESLKGVDAFMKNVNKFSINFFNFNETVSEFVAKSRQLYNKVILDANGTIFDVLYNFPEPHTIPTSLIELKSLAIEIDRYLFMTDDV